MTENELSSSEITRQQMKLECVNIATRISDGSSFASVGWTTAQEKAQAVMVTAKEIYDWITA